MQKESSSHKRNSPILVSGLSQRATRNSAQQITTSFPEGNVSGKSRSSQSPPNGYSIRGFISQANRMLKLQGQEEQFRRTRYFNTAESRSRDRLSNALPQEGAGAGEPKSPYNLPGPYIYKTMPPTAGGETRRSMVSAGVTSSIDKEHAFLESAGIGVGGPGRYKSFTRRYLIREPGAGTGISVEREHSTTGKLLRTSRWLEELKGQSEYLDINCEQALPISKLEDAYPKLGSLCISKVYRGSPQSAQSPSSLPTPNNLASNTSRGVHSPKGMVGGIYTGRMGLNTQQSKSLAHTPHNKLLTSSIPPDILEGLLSGKSTTAYSNRSFCSHSSNTNTCMDATMKAKVRRMAKSIDCKNATHFCSTYSPESGYIQTPAILENTESKIRYKNLVQNKFRSKVFNQGAEITNETPFQNVFIKLKENKGYSHTHGNPNLRWKEKKNRSMVWNYESGVYKAMDHGNMDGSHYGKGFSEMYLTNKRAFHKPSNFVQFLDRSLPYAVNKNLNYHHQLTKDPNSYKRKDGEFTNYCKINHFRVQKMGYKNKF